MNVDYSRLFKKQYKKLDPKKQKQFDERLVLFVLDSSASRLRKHKLTGKHPEVWSINISGDLRALYQVLEDDNVLFVKIGTHSELYK